MGGPPSVCVVVSGEGGGGESLFILFLVSGVPVFLGGVAGGTDPRAPQYPYYVSSKACREAGTARIAAHRLTAERRALGARTARRVLVFALNVV